ncbi:MAG: hypothetical protein JW982_03110 [Spirochaetes bacterium]|nr:hypothetical protein [Spirochaetota bacterium]
MPSIPLNKMTENFPFLDDRLEQEPFLYDVLLEIHTNQKQYLMRKKTQLATRESVKKSRSIKMPVTPARNKNLDFIIDLLLERYPEHIVPILSFDMSFDEKEKKLKFSEIEEFTISMRHEQFKEIEALRDLESLQHFLGLIAKFRIFNLSKVLEKAKNKNTFNRILKSGENIYFFTYKSYMSTKGQTLSPQELCFHVNNYESVKKSLNTASIKTIIQVYNEMVKTRLKNYGILNSEFNDYSDNKVDYLIHILEDDIGTSMSLKDLAEVKSYKSLRECIMRVDKIIDPVRIYGNEIKKFIKKNIFCYNSDITSNILNVTDEILQKWASSETLKKEHIVKYSDPSGRFYLIDGTEFITQFQETYNLIRFDQQKFNSLTTFQKQFTENKMNTLYNSGIELTTSEDPEKYLNCSSEDILRLKQLLEEYSSYMKEKNLRQEFSAAKMSLKKKKSLLGLIGGIIKAIFSIFSSQDKINGNGENSSGSEDYAAGSSYSTSGSPIPASSGRAVTLSKDAKSILARANAKRGPVLALSEFIELSKENDATIDKLIKEMRDTNAKIIMPVYNARTKLYPKRSAKLLVGDIEYLLFPPEVIKTPETITAYIDSLVGHKFKDDIISGIMLSEIEKYLRTINRQKRAQMLRRE